MTSVGLFDHPSTIYMRMIFSFMLRMTSLTSHFAWIVSILILTRFIAGQLTMTSFSMARKHRLWLYAGIRVGYTNKVRNLGMIVDNRLSFRDQANDIRRRVNFALSRLWHYADVTPVLTRKRLVQPLIVPYCLYCDVIYSQASAGVNRQLNVTFNSCARYIYGPDFRAFCLFLVRFLASRLVNFSIFAWIWWPTTCFRHAVLLICSIVFSEPVSNWNALPPVIKMKPSLAAFRGS
jgi:hypothetical protein